MRAEAAALDDALRHELQAVPGLRVIDISDQPEMPVDSVRKSHRADWIIRGALDRLGDSVAGTVRLLDAHSGAEVRSSLLRQASPALLQSAATALGRQSLFGTVRYALDSVLLERWQLSLGTDSGTADLRQRARAVEGRATDALVSVGPRRMLEELALADSLLATAQRQSRRSALPPYARTRLGIATGFDLMVARQYFPDSTWLPEPADAFRQALPFAGEAVARAPEAADAWFLRSRLYSRLLLATADPSWRDSALVDLRKASALAGSRADIWAMRAEIEVQSGLWKEARFSAEQGEAADHLHTNAENLRYRRSLAELALGEFGRARASCQWGARAFPGSPYFIPCEAEVLGRSSSRTEDATKVLVLADSVEGHDDGTLSPVYPPELRLFAVAILSRAGQADSAARVYDRVVGAWRGVVDPVLLQDAVYARQELGDLDSALAIAARTVRVDPGAASLMERLPWYQALRRHPGFASAMKGIAPRGAR